MKYFRLSDVCVDVQKDVLHNTYWQHLCEYNLVTRNLYGKEHVGFLSSSFETSTGRVMAAKGT